MMTDLQVVTSVSGWSFPLTCSAACGRPPAFLTPPPSLDGAPFRKGRVINFQATKARLDDAEADNGTASN